MTLSRFPGVSFPPNFTAEIPTAIPFSPLRACSHLASFLTRKLTSVK